MQRVVRDKRFGGARLPRKKRAMPGKEQRQTEITQPKASKRIVRISEVVSVGDLAKSMGVKAGEVVKKLMEQGFHKPGDVEDRLGYHVGQLGR